MPGARGWGWWRKGQLTAATFGAVHSSLPASRVFVRLLARDSHRGGLVFQSRIPPQRPSAHLNEPEINDRRREIGVFASYNVTRHSSWIAPTSSILPFLNES